VTAPTPARDERPASYRYAAVFLLTLVLVVFLVVAPAGDWSRAVALALQGGALGVVVGTSRARRRARGTRAAVVSVVAGMVLTGIAAVVLPVAAELALSGLLAIAIPFSLAGGLLRLVRERGVTRQAVAGALAIYLLVGVTFSSAIGFVANVDDAPYFAEGTDGTPGERVYFSFTVLTTTGFGDFTADTSVGRALAVVEMLAGQLYLVTVIGVLVGGLAGRRRADVTRIG
jgi:prepilin signal peptidase PulO-like enzyme (type II secretory pathway)